jgi:hypothetical protein
LRAQANRGGREGDHGPRVSASQREAELRADPPIAPIDPKREAALVPSAAMDGSHRSGGSTPTYPRGGAKIAQVIELLQRGDGSTLAELVAVTSCLPHTTRAALTGLRKRGYVVAIDRSDKRTMREADVDLRVGEFRDRPHVVEMRMGKKDRVDRVRVDADLGQHPKKRDPGRNAELPRKGRPMIILHKAGIDEDAIFVL